MKRKAGFVAIVSVLTGCWLNDPYNEPADVCEMRVRDRLQFYEVCDPRTYPEDPTKRQHCREIDNVCGES